jgi:DNA topoisomerase-3
MKVCIAEKPSVAREIAAILGATSRQDGYFEGNGYAVTWTFGHFCELKNPNEYEPHWKRWDMNTLPILPHRFEIKLKNDQGVKKQFKVIKELFKKAEVVINCGDAGQEGELIQRWVMKQAKYQGPTQRLWISSLTAEAIKDGFQNLKDGADFDNLYYAGFSRAIGDWLLGINATRLFTLKYGGYKQMLSIGRVQTPTLAMLVQRHLEILNFKPEPFWELQTQYREVTFNSTKGKFKKKEEGEELLAKIEGQPFSITSVEKKNAKEAPPRLFDLTSLQVHCNKRFSYSADMTLKIAQKLYERKVITYPRVDTTYLPTDIYPKVPGILQRMNQYSQFTQSLLGKKLRKSAKVFNDKKVTDHHAIIPTGYEQGLDEASQNVYDAIARRFIAAFYPDCLVAKTTVLGESVQVPFKANGKEILDPGWRVLFPKKAKKKDRQEESDPKKKEEEEKILPAFTVGESGAHEPKLVEKQTQPPKAFTEGTLLRSMETAGKQVDDDELRDLMKENGIGRPSTRAAIIETLFRRKYIQRKRKQIIPTETGIQLIGVIQNDLLKSAELTGQWEKQLRQIEKGEYSSSTFVKGMKEMVRGLSIEVQEAAYKRIFQETVADKIKPKAKSKSKSSAPAEMSCPKCKQGKMLKGKTAYGCSRYKEGCDFRVPFVIMGKKISENQVKRLVGKGATVYLKGFQTGGKKEEGRILLGDEFELKYEAKFEKEEPQSDMPTCPKCGVGHLIKGKTAYGCSRWKAGCDFRFPFEELRRRANGEKLTKDLALKILAEG